MEKFVINYMKNHQMIEKNDHLVVGVSGGPDSMALLHILWKYKRRWDVDLTVAHVNHCLRGKEADLDQEMVESYCKERGIAHHSIRVDVAARAKELGMGVEETGREVRYTFFRALAKEGAKVKIVTGHHRDDQVETVLMRLLRGTGINGLRGMEPVRSDGVLRPFLEVSKEEILTYCKEESIPYRLDATNEQDTYHRNRLRLQLIPLLRTYNPRVEEALLRLSRQADEHQRYIDGQLERSWSACRKGKGFSVELFLKEEALMQKSMLLRAAKEEKEEAVLESRHVDLALKKIRDQEDTVWQLDLPEGLLLRRSYDRLVLEKQGDKKIMDDFQYSLRSNKTYGFPRLGIIVKLQEENPEIFFGKQQKSNEFFMDYDRMIKIGTTLTLRQRKAGDRLLNKEGLSGRKLKKVFIDEKVPVEMRDKIPIVALEHGLVWVPGLAKSCCLQPTENTSRVLHITIYNVQEETND